MAHDIAGLERKIKSLGEAISKLQKANHVEALIPIIHRPGWTTIIENEFVNFHVDSLSNQISALHKSLDAVVSLAGKIGQK